MGSSRRFGATDIRLQKVLRQRDPTFDASQMPSPTVGDRSTRFDYEQDERFREEVERKREVRFELYHSQQKKYTNILGSNKSLERCS